MVIHTSKTPPSLNCTLIKGQQVELVNSFKYLGLTTHNKLNFNEHVITTHNRAHKRLYVIRKLKSLSVAPTPPLTPLQKHHPTHPNVLFPLLLHPAHCYQQKQTPQNPTHSIQDNQPPQPNLSGANYLAIARLARVIVSSP